MKITKSFLIAFAFILSGMFLTETFAQSGGKIASNAKITVSPPRMQNGTKADDWIPIFVQGQLSTDFQNNSDFSVIDRVAAEQIAGEQKVREAASSIANESAGIQYAQLLAADYSVSVSIVNKGGSYSLDCKVLSVLKSRPVGKAYSNANISKDALTDGSEIHKAAYELLKGMGVAESRLSELKTQISSHDEKQAAQIAAQINLSKGIALDQNGMSVEAMTYYLKASEEDKRLREAARRLSVTSIEISGANFGVQAEDLIKFRNQWITLLKNTAQYLENNPPFIYVYDKIEMLELGESDYKNNTQGFKLKGNLFFTDEYGMILNFNKSLRAIPESRNWGKEVESFPCNVASKNSWINKGTVCVTLSLRDAEKNIIKSVRQYFTVEGYKIKPASKEVRFNEIPIEQIKSTDTLIASVDKVEFVSMEDENNQTHGDVRNMLYYQKDEENYNRCKSILKKWDVSIITLDGAPKKYERKTGHNQGNSIIINFTGINPDESNKEIDLMDSVKLRSDLSGKASETFFMRLGITVEDARPGELRVTEIIPDSPADKAGLEIDDIINSALGYFNESGRFVPCKSFYTAVESCPAGSAVMLDCVRKQNDKIIYFSIKIKLQK